MSKQEVISNTLSQFVKIESSIMAFIKAEENEEQNFSNLLKLISETNIVDSKANLSEFILLIASIYSMLFKQEKIVKLKKILSYFLNDIRKCFSSRELFALLGIEYCPDYHLLKIVIPIIHFFIDNKIISIKQIIDRTKFYSNSICQFLIYFLPEIKEADESYYNELKGILPIEAAVIENNREFEGNNSSQKNCLEAYIREDNIAAFQDSISKQNINLEKYFVDVNFFNIAFNLLPAEKYSLIEYAAFYGSKNIFKFLHLNIKFDELDKAFKMYKAVIGGSHEIIHLLEKKHFVFDEFCLECAIKVHNQEIYEYILNNYDIYENEEENESEIATESINFTKNNFIYENKLSRLRLALVNYNYQVISNIITDDNFLNDMSMADAFGILLYCCDMGIPSVLLFLIEHKNIDINTTNRINLLFNRVYIYFCL